MFLLFFAVADDEKEDELFAQWETSIYTQDSVALLYTSLLTYREGEHVSCLYTLQTYFFVDDCYIH